MFLLLIKWLCAALMTKIPEDKTSMRSGKKRALLDTNIWRYVVDQGAQGDFLRLARVGSYAVQIAPGVLYETLRLKDVPLRASLVRLMTNTRFRRLMPEAYSNVHVPSNQPRNVCVIARIPAEGIVNFRAYEDAVLPLLPEFNGRLERRLRNQDGTVEVHIVSFVPMMTFKIIGMILGASIVVGKIICGVGIASDGECFLVVLNRSRR